MPFVHPRREAIQELMMRGRSGPVTMLNLLRFREVADYSAFEALAPEAPISGEAAYDRYVAHALPHVKAAGAEVLFSGRADVAIIGPAEEQWDRVLLVKHRSLDDFLAFANNAEYLAGVGHRTAALLDSRLIPIVD